LGLDDVASNAAEPLADKGNSTQRSRCRSAKEGRSHGQEGGARKQAALGAPITAMPEKRYGALEDNARIRPRLLAGYSLANSLPCTRVQTCSLQFTNPLQAHFVHSREPA
jgi:hypothetical protein